jgi:hypothetical protein
VETRDDICDAIDAGRGLRLHDVTLIVTGGSKCEIICVKDRHRTHQ